MAGRLGSPGMLRSSTTTAGRCLRAHSSAGSTSPASATTFRSGSASSRTRRPLRTIAWSSAITMLTGTDATLTGEATMGRLYRRRPPLGSRPMDDALRRRARAGLRLRRRARRRALALPRDGDRPRPARRADRRHRLDVDRRRCRATSTSSSWPRASATASSAAGGVPLGFNTIAVSDNQSQGTPGMRASLISREVIADSIELMVHAHDFDALVCLVGCDKTVPAALMALARVDKPAVVLYSGPMRAGRLRGREVTIQDVWEAVGAEERGLTRARGARRARARRVPRRRHLRRPLHREHDGGRARLPRASRRRRRAHPRRRASSEGRRRRRGPGALAVAARRLRPDRADVPRPPRAPERDGRHRRDRRLDERRSCTCSRSRSEAGVAARRSTSSPRRRAHAGDREPRARRAASWPRTSTARRHRRADPRARPRRPTSTATRRRSTARRSPRRRATRPRPTARCVFTSRAVQADAARCTRCAATSRPTAASSSSPAAERAQHRGPARVFDSEEACADAVRAGGVGAGRRARRALRGPGRRAGHARDAERHVVRRRRGARRDRSRSSPTGASPARRAG